MFTSIQSWTDAVDPMKVAMRVEATWEGTPQAEVRGRILGPKCPGTTTIEVAYPLHVLEAKPGACMLKVIIPEPSFWDPETPFYYSLVIELWEGAEKIDKRVQTMGWVGKSKQSQPRT